jgi:hypothetical protein
MKESEKRYEFNLIIAGHGETPDEAWEAALESFVQDPGTTPENFQTFDLEAPEDCQIDAEGFCQTHQRVHARERAEEMGLAVPCPTCGYRGPELHVEASTACKKRLSDAIRREAVGEALGSPVTFNTRELATVLAALRLWQQTANRHEDPLWNIATDEGTLEPLDEDEIDALCEQLNT